jgi:hypothetical protein
MRAARHDHKLQNKCSLGLKLALCCASYSVLLAEHAPALANGEESEDVILQRQSCQRAQPERRS